MFLYFKLLQQNFPNVVSIKVPIAIENYKLLQLIRVTFGVT